MLFNSAAFLFLYLPIVLAGTFVLARVRPRWTIAWLGLASFAFYADWNWRFLALLLGIGFLHETLDAHHLIGMALIGLGLAAIDGRPLRWLKA